MCPVEDRADYLLSLISGVSGLDKVEIRTLRNYPYPWMRGLVMAQLCAEGYTLSQCGRGLGVHHSTALYWRNLIAANIKMGFPSLPEVRDAKWGFDAALGEAVPDAPPEIPGVPYEARVVLQICRSALEEFRAQKHIQEKTQLQIIDSITNKIKEHYGCKNSEASC